MTSTVTENQQHLEALASANEVRIHRVDQLRRLAQLEVSLETLLLDPNMGVLEIGQVLMPLPSKAVATRPGILPRSIDQTRRIIQRSGVRSGRTIGSLTDQSRAAVLDAAFDLAGCRAWIFAADKAPKKPRPRKVREDRRPVAQNLAALEKANKVRSERVKLKRQLRDGELTLEDALNQDAFATWTLGKLVVHLRRTTLHGDGYLKTMAPGSAKRVLAKNRISPFIKVGDLSEQSKRLLVMLYTDERFCAPTRTAVPA